MKQTKIFVVLPAKDEASRIGDVLKETLALGYTNIVVVNDGSADNTAEVAENHGVNVINHAINLGAGAATQTGIEYAVSQGADIIVTLDADRQHYPGDIDKLVQKILHTDADLVIGSRFLNKENKIPSIRIFYNRIGNHITHIFTGLKISDSQSGMKAMKADFVNHTKINSTGYEFCIEIIRNAKKYKATIAEVPIRVSYSKESMEKGQSFVNGVKTVFNLFKLVNRLG